MRASWLVSPSGVLAWSRFLPGLRRRLARTALNDIRQARRLAVVRADGMGDLVLTTGLLRELRRQLPRTRIALVCQATWAPWLRTCPWIDEVVDVRMSSDDRLPLPRQAWEAGRFLRRLWSFDAEVLVHPGTLHWYAASRALAWLSGAPLRIAWEDPEAGVDTGARFYSHCLPLSNRLHETEKCARLLESMGLESAGPGLAAWHSEEDARLGRSIATRAGSRARTLVAFGLAASEVAKRWPAERFIELGRSLGVGVSVLVLGGHDVATDCRHVARALGTRALYPGPDLPLGAVWAAIAQCRLYVGNDSGLVHMSAASGVPVVAILSIPREAPPEARGSPTQTGPVGVPSRVLRPAGGCAASPSPTRNDIPLASAVAAAHELLCDT